MLNTMLPMLRNYSRLDQWISQTDQILRSFAQKLPPQRPYPADHTMDSLTVPEKQLAGRLMRVNHSGEICAQALYQGQALTTQASHTRVALQQSATEEIDHLAWCQQRINELGSHTSYLNPLWYCGSLVIGAMVSLSGDAWNLGFLAETERQVVKHLEKHLQALPVADTKSRQILLQMREDEQKHASTATLYGAKPLPWIICFAMRTTAKLMTTLAYWV